MTKTLKIVGKQWDMILILKYNLNMHMGMKCSEDDQTYYIIYGLQHLPLTLI